MRMRFLSGTYSLSGETRFCPLELDPVKIYLFQNPKNTEILYV